MRLPIVVACFASATVLQSAPGPAILSVTPSPGTTLTQLTSVTITFTEPVSGVTSADLLINELPVASRTGAGAAYTFQFSPPPPGLVALNLDSDTAIADAEGNPLDPFASNASWTYTVVDALPPTVHSSTPVAAALIGTLTQIEVEFTEPVTGVDASDLRINGQVASSLAQTGPATYLFSFAQPASGTVNISWAAGHDIRDLAPVANAFDGLGWAYTLNPAAATGDVVINEFLADNLTSLEDEDSQKQDWIEVHNRGASSVNLLGWSLTDDPTQPGKWTFPAINLAAGQYLVVFASGKDRKATAPGATNHASFALNAGGAYLGLFNAELPREVVSEFAPFYPPQRGDISYGHAAGGVLAYFRAPTPGAANAAGQALSGFADPPHTSVQSGLFDQPFALALTTRTRGASIRYTLDGSVPTENSTLYSGPITIAGTPLKGVVMLRAAAFQDGLLPSSVITRTFIFPDHVLTQPANPAGFPAIWDSPCTVGVNCRDAQADYEMDPQVLTNTTAGYAARARQGLMTIPSISITTHSNLLFGPAQGVYVRREPFNQQQVNVELLLPDGGEGFNVQAGLEIVGGTSPNDQDNFWKVRKLSMRLIFRGEFGATKLRYRVFPDSPVDSFDTLILDAGLNYVWSYNGGSSPDDQRQRAQYVRDQFMSDLQNSMGRVGPHGRYVHVYLNGLYWGLYDLHERPDHSFSADYFGGDKEEYDVIKHRLGTVVNGSATTYNTMLSLARSGVANNSAYENLQQYLDVPWFIDYMILNLWAGNTDWAHQNWYASRRRAPGAGWRYLSWDAEHVMKSANENVTGKNDANGPTELLQLLRNNAEFRLLFADHVQRHFFNDGVFHVETNSPIWNDALLAKNRPAALYMKRIREIDPAIVTESARWGDTGETGTPRATNPLTRDREWLNELNALMGRTNLSGYTVNYFPNRSSTVLNQLRTIGLFPANLPPIFGQHGGRVARGFHLYLTNVSPGAVIYYTTNGADPRAYGSGTISAHARVYDGAGVPLQITTVVKARTLAGSTWSALNEATFLVASLAFPLRITEINYNPIDGDAYEFIEMENVGSTVLDLSGYTFDGINFIFPPGSIVAPGAILVLANNANPAAFASRYPGVAVTAYFGGALANGGERIALEDPFGQIVFSVTYDDEGGWPAEADGRGYTLVANPASDSDAPASWTFSAELRGNPGQPGGAAVVSGARLNELMAENLGSFSNGGAFPDWVELFNPEGGPVNLEGWSLSDDGNARKFVFPAGTIVAPNGYLIVWLDDTSNTTPGLHAGFSLEKSGDSLFLYNAATQRIDAVSFGFQIGDHSLGRIASEWNLNTPTPNGANAAADLASQTNLAINEWLANPLPGADDWIEIFNRSASLPAALHGVHLASSNAIFQIRSHSFLPPGGFIQVFADEQDGLDHVDFKLPASGGLIVLYDHAGVEVDRVAYGPQTESVSQGRLPDGASNQMSFAGSVSPASANYVITYSGPLLNEIAARNESAVPGPQGQYPDWIELHNPNSAAFNLAGMRLSDAPNNAAPWTFPTGASISANGHLVVWFDDTRPASIELEPALNTGRALNGNSGGVYLFNTQGQLVDSVEYGSQIVDLPIGRSGGQWKLLSAPTPNASNALPAVLGDPTSLRINEWMASTPSGEDWFELFNTTAEPVELSGLLVTDDLSLAGRAINPLAPLSYIGARGFARLVADASSSSGADHVVFALNDQGEALRLYATNFAVIDTISFGAQSAGVSQGRLPDGATVIVSFPASPTPAESNFLPLSEAVINEVLTHSVLPLEDALEIHNPTDSPVDISGWFLSDSQADFKKYQIAAGTIVPAHGFKVFYEGHFNGGAGSLVPFTFDSAHGDEAWLSAADAAGNLTGYRAAARFGAAANGASFGRYETSVGVDYPAVGQRTFGVNLPVSVTEFRTGTGEANDLPEIGLVVINEVMYHAPGEEDDVSEEFIELHNISYGASAPLYDPMASTNAWRLRGGIEFDFPQASAIGPSGFLLVVGFDPSADPARLNLFRARYGLGTEVTILGPYRGKLSNDGEEVELYRPDAPQGPGPDEGFVPYILVDKVSYGAAYPWPSAADGFGASLQRRRPLTYGNDPANWKGVAPTPGRANVPGSGFADADKDGLPDDWELASGLDPSSAADNAEDADGDQRSNYQEFLDETDPRSAQSVLAPPVITTHPQSQLAVVGEEAVFSTMSSGTTPLNYLWRFQGHPISGETNSTLVLVGVDVSQAGAYSVAVWNAAGLAISQSAILTTYLAPSITLHPTSQTVSNGGNVTFAVAASASAALRYQWRHQGEDIPGATNTDLTLTNVQLTDAGEYVAVVRDEVATVMSQPAILTVLVRPQILDQPMSVTVLAGNDGAISVRARGTLPLGFRWRRNSATLPNPRLTFTTNVALSEVTCLLTITNVQTSVTGRFDVIITNRVNTIGLLSANAALLVVSSRPILTDLHLLPGNTAKMNLLGDPNRSYRVEYSTNLSNWVTLGTVVYTNGPAPVTDGDAVDRVRFYRAQVVP